MSTRNQVNQNIRPAKSAYPRQHYKHLDDLQQPRKSNRKPIRAANTLGSQRIHVTGTDNYRNIASREPATLVPSTDGLLPGLHGVEAEDDIQIQQPEQQEVPHGTRQSQRARKTTVSFASRPEETPAPSTSDSAESDSDSDAISLSSSDNSSTSTQGSASDISIHTARRSPSPTPQPEAPEPPPVRRASKPPTKLTTALLDLYPFCNPLPEERKYLPFLCRNARKGFTKTFGGGILSGQVDIDVTYVLPNARKPLRWTGNINKYLCPMCTLFNGLFKNREILTGHLRRDHSEVTFQWSQKEGENSWELLVTFPLPPKKEPSSPSRLHHPVPLRPAESISEVLVKVREESVSPTQLEFTPSAPDLIPIPPSNRPPHLPVTPPPIDRPLGPSAQPPFLPANPIETANEGRETQYHGKPIYYSCRPEGPKIYDLLGTLPLDDFGVMQWEILEREEEIFESDEFTDEMKVISALWNRWYWLKGNDTFRRNHFKGVTAFIHYYWKMIHRAAGWEALRNFLLLLQVYRLLNTMEVAKVLREYEAYTRMSEWPTGDSQDNHSEGNQLTDMEVE